ncbi:unnamed protein product [Closterium sp. NIES-64]|nr:unnamed protein product [Closterium sp. NIES-64]
MLLRVVSPMVQAHSLIPPLAPTPALYKPHPSPASHSHHGQFPSLLVRWAINRCGGPSSGCGDVTEKKSGPALALIPSSRLVAVMRRNATLAQDYAQRHHVPRWGLALALIPSSHLVAVMRRNATLAQDYAQRHHVPRYAIMAARAGKPAYVEKPMGMSHVDSSDILAAFQRAKLPLFVAYYRRALPNFLRVVYHRPPNKAHPPNPPNPATPSLQIKALLESGAIGDVLSVQVVYHRPPNKYDYQWALSGVPSQKELQTMLQQQQQERRGGNEEGSGAREQQQRQYPYRPLPQHHPAGASLHNATLKWRVDPCRLKTPSGASLRNASLKWRVDLLVGVLGGYFRDKGSHQQDLLDLWFGPVGSHQLDLLDVSFGLVVSESGNGE